MGDFYRVLRVFWAPSQTLSDAAHRPFVIIPLLVPTLFAAITSLVVYFKFPPADAALRTVWFILLVSATLGPILIALAVSSFFFGVFSLIGRQKRYVAFLSVTALAFVPTAFHHLAQGGILLWSSVPSLQGLNLQLLVEQEAVSSRIYVAAGMVGVFSIWVLALLIVGYRFLGSRPSPLVSPSVVIGGWLVYAAIRIALADTFAF